MLKSECKKICTDNNEYIEGNKNETFIRYMLIFDEEKMCTNKILLFVDMQWI